MHRGDWLGCRAVGSLIEVLVSIIDGANGEEGRMQWKLCLVARHWWLDMLSESRQKTWVSSLDSWMCHYQELEYATVWGGDGGGEHNELSLGHMFLCHVVTFVLISTLRYM